jgi:hypothetical protein
MSENNQASGKSQEDYSKKKEIVLADLIVKGVSALAIVGIGIAGFLIQQHLQNAQLQEANRDKVQRAAADQRDQEEQAYLPCLRGISEVDLALEEVSSEFGWPRYTAEEADRESRLGTRLAYIADSLYFPAAKDPGGPEITLRTAAANMASSEPAADPQTITITVEEAVRLLSEMLRLSPMLYKMNREELTAQVDGPSLSFRTSSGKLIDSIPLERRTVPAFNRWLPQPVNAHLLYTDVDLTGMADEIGKQISEIAKEQIREHPKLADKYIVIRSDVLRGRQELLSLSK